MNREEFQQAKMFMFTDIFREIELGRASAHEAGKAALTEAGVRLGGGNFLAALGLLCYTEFGGKLKYHCKRNGRDHASENFNLFFDDLGSAYKAFRAEGHNVYDIFRCGLAHEYYVKRSCTIAMLGTDIPAGIRILPDGRYEFIVERYCLDLKRAFDELGTEFYPAPEASA